MASLACLAGILLLVYAVSTIERRVATPERLARVAPVLSDWSSPTQSLLGSNTNPLLKTVPRLGETYFEVKPVVEPSELQVGGIHAN